MIQMQWLIYLILSLEICGEKIKDEDRPYEFSFTIDSEQHRYEKKDINGIIQGEFGFITADGVYHVTVYATDENGNFKIISMKNIKISERLDQISELPKIPELQHRTSPPPVQYQSSTVRTTERVTAKPILQFNTASTVRVGCGGCGIITTPSSLTEFFKARTSKVEEKPVKYNIPIINTITKTKERTINYFPSPNALSVSPTVSYPATSDLPTSIQATPSSLPHSDLVELRFDASSEPSSYVEVENDVLRHNPVHIQDFAPKQAAPYSLDISSKAKVDNGFIKIPGNAPIHIQDKYPNMVEGLPNGITKEDISDLLYKFNYTVGFHGHYEKGWRNGTKVGGYFVNGRDGYSRVVTYVADELGYRPKFKLIRLGLDSLGTPKEDTEKTFGLQHFEFVWYPIK